MLFTRAGQLLLIATLAISPALASRHHHAPTAGSAKHHKTTSAKIKRISGQRVIDAGRATEIQQALIRDKYLNGTASGKWDAETQAAMQKYQSDHGWQTKLMPDSRALISLGLGPNHDTDLPTVKTAVSGVTPVQPADQANDTLASVHSISQ